MKILQTNLKGKSARLQTVTLANMTRFTRDSYIHNNELFVTPDKLSLYLSSNTRYLRKCPGCGEYSNRLSILTNFPPLCKECIGELWYYSDLAIDPFNLKGKKTLSEMDCKKIVSHIRTLRITSKSARRASFIALAKLFSDGEK